MSATSESSDTGPSNSSGRASMEDGFQQSGGSLGRHRHHHPFGPNAFAPFAFGARRSSTPATSFLPPRFWQTSSQTIAEQPGTSSSTAGERNTFSGNANELKSGGHLQQTGVQQDDRSPTAMGWQQSQAPHSSYSHIPRRTSFGTGLNSSGRFTPLSAFGFSPGSPLWSSSQRGGSAVSDDYITSPPDIRKMPSNAGGLSPTMQSSHALPSSADSTPAPSLPASPVQKPQRSRTVYLPGPDGICVESRVKRRPEA